MRILMLNYEFPPLGGGASNANFYLLKELAKKKDLKIDLITSSVDKFKKEKFSSNINIYYLDIGKNNQNPHFQTNKELLVYSLKSYFFARKLLKKNNYNLVHAWFGIPCGFIATLLGKPYIVSLRGSDVPFYNSRFKNLDKYFFRYLSKLIWKKAKTVIANSQGLKELAQKTAPNQEIQVIHNGVDTNEFKFSKTKEKSRNLRILCVARLIRRKGIDYLIKALGKLKNQGFILTIIGDGKERESLVSLAKKLKIDSKVKFLGPVPHPEIIKYYQQNDIFILPSLNEGMSNTVLEAMACGLPIIATNVGGSRELVKDNGFIVKPKSILEIKNAIENYLNKHSLLLEQGKISIEIAEKMSWQDVTKQYLEIYKK